jgi:hypothetical protein
MIVFHDEKRHCKEVAAFFLPELGLRTWKQKVTAQNATLF